MKVKILETVEAPSEGVAIEEAERVLCVGMGGADLGGIGIGVGPVILSR
jgi:hypothetical protein